MGGPRSRVRGSVENPRAGESRALTGAAPVTGLTAGVLSRSPEERIHIDGMFTARGGAGAYGHRSPEERIHIDGMFTARGGVGAYGHPSDAPG